MNTLAKIILASGSLSLLSLLSLHFLSPEIRPSWRLVSEYAYGRHKSVLTAFFLLWGISTVLTTILLWNETAGIWARIGLLLVFISGTGACMGGLFDVNHSLHGAAFGLGVPSLPAGALLVGYHLIKKAGWMDHSSTILISSHSVWISLVLMAVAMIVMMNGFKEAGMPMEKNAPPPDRVPDGVIAVAGYFNRILVICYAVWVILMAKIYLSIHHSS